MYLKSLLADRDVETTEDNVAALTALTLSVETAGFDPFFVIGHVSKVFEGSPSFNDNPEAFEIVANYMSTYLNDRGFYPMARYSEDGDFRTDGLLLELIGVPNRGIFIDAMELSAWEHPNGLTAALNATKAIMDACVDEITCDACKQTFQYAADGTTQHLNPEGGVDVERDNNHPAYMVDVDDWSA